VPTVVQVAFLHHHDTAGLQTPLARLADLVHLARGQAHAGRNTTLVIEAHVQLQCTVSLAKLSPWKDCQ